MISPYIITWVTQYQVGIPLDELRVRAFDVDRLSTDDFLGEGQTNQEGLKFDVVFKRLLGCACIFFAGQPQLTYILKSIWSKGKYPKK